MQPETDYGAARAAHVEATRKALLRHRGDPVASHESAALVHRVATYRVPATARLTRSHGSRRTSGRTHVHVAELAAADVTVVRGIPVTSLARTVIDVARDRPFIEALVVADSALRAGLPRCELDDLLVRMWNWPNIRKAATLVRWADKRSESPCESVVRARCILLELAVPQLQTWFEIGHRDSARVDFYWEEHGLIGEADGRVKYTSEDVLWQEKQRRDALEERHILIRWTWRQAHAPDEVFRARLLAAFAKGDRLKVILAAEAAC